ncbi:hypothetical protein [Lactiplantibacillus plantarum]|uniref:hypothetical protein n=1 Tax=Lactiplantibacillus plantarum TaxID=1590 RepID=UPI000F8D2254|nr:hypothetical protein [Lactiplantibacillus plantarum]MDN7065953.1 hypothetical protein [Lactiplantibacillus plantarum]MDN7072060.1 hypothetical protein [Lactiplantibacillus plantarum]MDP5372465.1 hypothetical protein [Lactiplantibacillus plantarum]RUS44143.1 hypothetical protein EL800_03280 [Lactiplantibacillus plantarum]RXK93324.1 hypothetical protein ETC33_02590 [Lactiplantibacillus plantarum]
MDDNEREALAIMKKAYQDEIAYIMGVNNTDFSRFYWADNRCLKMYLIKVFSTLSSQISEKYIFFATKDTSDSIEILNFEKETHTFQFENTALVMRNVLNYMVSNKLLSKDIVPKIVPESFVQSFFRTNINVLTQDKNLSRCLKKFADAEYKKTHDQLITQNKIEKFPLTQTKLFVDTYHFDQMLSTLNDNQFTDEFNQCLFAYQNQKWFLCAAGLGSCLEHLMLLTLSNYHKETQLGRNPTAKDYLKAFTKEPIKLESRQQTFIDALFRLRNSVDHHNSGITSKRICDTLLDGISDVFNEYYIPSIKAF